MDTLFRKTVASVQVMLHVTVTDRRTAGLIVHDRKDRIVPYSHAKELSTAWPSARLFDTHKPGHSRILQDEEVIHKDNWGQSKNPGKL